MNVNELRQRAGIPQTKMEFVTDCVSANGNDIIDMCDTAKEISYRTFCLYVDPQSLRDTFHTYDWSRRPRSLTLQGDYHVRYYKSHYLGRPCVFVDHSAIEYVFC